MTTDRLQAEKNGESECIILYTLTRVEADITSSLGMKTTTELCHQKCRRIQACGHNRAGIVIYIMGVGSGGGGAKTEGDGNPVQCQYTVRSVTE